MIAQASPSQQLFLYLQYGQSQRVFSGLKSKPQLSHSIIVIPKCRTTHHQNTIKDHAVRIFREEINNEKRRVDEQSKHKQPLHDRLTVLT